MPSISIERIKNIKTFPSLIKFLREDLNWDLTADDIEDLTFEYEPDELGINPEIAVKIKEIKQLRPFAENQPWGIFYIAFEPKRLPVVVLRRVLQALVIKKRQSAGSSKYSIWNLHDLLFISSYGEEEQRAITFAHFSEDSQGDLPTLKVIGWDTQDTPLHIEKCIKELNNLKFDSELSQDKWREQWASAFTLKHREVISTSKALATKLAQLAGQIRSRVNAVLKVESKQGQMTKLFKACQETLLHDLDHDRFADMFAQTVAYGLFSARCSRTSGALIADNLTDMIPETNLFLRELLSTFFTVAGKKEKINFDEIGINDVVEMLRNANMEAVLRDFNDKNPSEDPVIHFYEDFLRQYDAHQKIKRGAFYTPKPVVSFIVRSVHEILKKDFRLEYGLADISTWAEMAKRNKDIEIPKGVSADAPFVQILDPAAGTGTFLVEAIDLIYKTMAEKWENENKDVKKMWNDYVSKYLLPRIYGFELMMAPYSIAHVKIALKLIETGYVFNSDETIRIYLTNSLEPAKDTLPGYLEKFSPAMAKEAKAANKVKQNVPITVVIGNPPYAYKSANTGDWISNLVRDYYEVDGNPLGERNPKGLQDDYVKFIRFGQDKIDNVSKGILAFITNHSFLDNPTFKGMRQSLIDSFNQIYFIDLHGNADKKEKTPDGEKDQNIFDIKQGVATSIMVKKKDLKKRIYHSDFWGKREEKYTLSLKSSLKSIDKTELKPNSPFYLFTPQKMQLRENYDDFYSIKEIFENSQECLKTHRDHFVIDSNLFLLKNRIDDFLNITINDSEIKKKYDLKDNFDIKAARQSLSKMDKNKIDTSYCIIQYRPFDNRYIFYRKELIDRDRKNIMKHMKYKNIGLISTRFAYKKNLDYAYIFITSALVDVNHIQSPGSAQLFPIYLYDGTEDELIESSEIIKKENFTKSFRQFIDRLHNTIYTPEQILSYIYAILHSPTYRARYAEFLKIDFPRIPFTKNRDLFTELSQFGNELVALHLLESEKLKTPITAFPIHGDNSVAKVGEKGKTLANIKDGKGRLYINKTQYFDNIPENTWNFHIGGYQVCHKWLYDRMKAERKLSEQDIEHYHKIVKALDETIRIMKQIDEVIEKYGGFPIQ